MMKNVSYYFSRSEIAKEIKKELERVKLEKRESSFPAFTIKKRYDYSDFTMYDGETFIKNAFLGILGREVESDELNEYMGLLESKRRNKEEIVATLCHCEEGQKANVVVSDFKLRDSYTYDELTQYNGEEFISNAYLGLLRREADEGALEYFLGLLERGEMSKNEIVKYLNNCEEGECVGIRLL